MRYHRAFQDFDYPDDVRRVVLVAAKEGYFLSPMEADSIWRGVSDSSAASWLYLPDTDEDLFCEINSYLTGE